jgi:hypothetical protein
MKVVIEISEDHYNYLMSLQPEEDENLSYEMDIIRNSIPLSKVEEVIKTSEIIDRFGRTDSEDFTSFENGFKACLNEIDEAMYWHKIEMKE